MRRKKAVGFDVAERMRDVGEADLLRADARRSLDRLFKREMRGMPLVLEGIQHENVEVFQQFE